MKRELKRKTTKGILVTTLNVCSKLKYSITITNNKSISIIVIAVYEFLK